MLDGAREPWKAAGTLSSGGPETRGPRQSERIKRLRVAGMGPRGITDGQPGRDMAMQSGPLGWSSNRCNFNRPRRVQSSRDDTT